MIKVSILVPIFGVERFIERCTRSLMEQTYQNIEYIFVDDCSPDDSIKILNEVLADYNRNHVSIIRHEKNKGLGGARRTALFSATGDYILNVDSDDYIEPETVSILVNEVKRTGAEVVRMNCFFEWENSLTIYRGLWDNHPAIYTQLLLSAVTLPGVCFHFIKRQLYYDINQFPREDINTGEDFLLMPILCYHANYIGNIEQPLYHYIQTNFSSYTKNFNSKKVEDLQKVADILYNYFCDKPNFVKALNEGMWQKKVETMLSCHYQHYPLVDQLPTWLPMSTTTMKTQQKLAAPLVAGKHWKLLWIYSTLYNWAFNIYQKFKGR